MPVGAAARALRGRRIAASQTSTIQDFERDSLGHYRGDFGAYGITTTAIEGGRSLEEAGASVADRLVCVSGLEVHPEKGETFSFAFELRALPGDNDIRPGLIFGASGYDDHYLARIVHTNNELQLANRDAGSFSVLQTASYGSSLSLDTRYDIEVDWGSDDTITVRLLDGDTELASLSHSDATHAGARGIGWYQGRGDATQTAFDSLTTPSSPESGVVPTITFDGGAGAWPFPNGDITVTTNNGADREGYFCFKLSGVSGETVNFSITNFADTPIPSTGYHLVYDTTLADDNWTRFSGSADGGWSHTFSNDEVYVASYLPYPYSRTVDRVTNLSSNSLVTTETIGQSTRGRDMHAIRITDPDVADSGKQDVVYIARQHPGEVNASYHVDATIDWVINVYEGSQSFSNDYTWHFLPNANPDGMAYGLDRWTPEGANLNRVWDSSGQAEVDNMKTYLSNNVDDLHWGFDVHASPLDTTPVVHYDTANLTSSEETTISNMAAASNSLSGTESSSVTGYARSWMNGNLTGGPAVSMESWNYYEYTIAELVGEAEAWVQEITTVS